MPGGSGIAGNGQDNTGTTTDVHILQISGSTSTSLFSGNVDGYYGGDGGGTPSGTSPLVPFRLEGVALSAGDSLLFVVGDGGNGFSADSTGLQLKATFTSAPGAHGALVPDDPFGYLGGLGYWQDPSLADSGLSYVRQRWLENASGQWLSVDPVASEPRYGYANNSPTMGVDSTGTQIEIGNGCISESWPCPNGSS